MDFHALWVDPEYEGRLIVGDDGGVNISYDDGETWIAANSAPVGQFYTVAYDMDSPYNIYGGLQDNGVWYGPSAYSASKAWHITGDYPYDKIMGGDGFQVQVDFRDNTTVYTGFQFGHYYRVNKLTKKSDYITPKHELGERPYRWNWQTPIHLSRHHQDILYMGSNKFHRSMDKGENWFTNPKDLTAGGAKGNVPYGTLTTIDESPLRFGLIYTGGDDGKIHVSTDAGESWRDISDGIPSPYWVTRVAASAHDEATVYVSLNGYRWDNFEALVFRSTDYGATWTRIGEDLPLEPVNVVKEDPENERVLYVGTDHLVYVSLDGGETFQAMDGGLPHAPAHDLVAHPREKDLIVGTHGRSIYVADVEYIQKLTPEILAKPLHFFELGERTWSDGWGDRGWGWSDPNEPTIDLVVYVERASEATVRATGDDMTLREFDVSLDAGLNFVEFDFTIDANAADAYAEAIEERLGDEEIVVKPSDNGKTYLRPGDYEIVFETADASASNALKIKRPKKSKRGE